MAFFDIMLLLTDCYLRWMDVGGGFENHPYIYRIGERFLLTPKYSIFVQ
jgi:hypothetical protein